MSSKKKIEYEDSTDTEKSSKINNIQQNKIELLKKYESIEENSESESKLPKDFEKTWKAIKEMRNSNEAPVDTMGAEFCSDPSKVSREDYKFQCLISLLLSSQTKDPITFATMAKLIEHGLTVQNILDTEEEKIRDMIYGVSFHNNKAKFIKKLAQELKDKYDSDAPEEFKELISLPGIGPKMALIYLQVVCDKVEGIAVDTHLHRICNRLKWVNETKTPEHTRKSLESWLPKEYWPEFNLVLVGFGQTICAAVAPKCGQCKLNKSCEFGIERLNKLQSKSKSKSKSRSKSKSKVKLSQSKTESEQEKNSDDNDIDTPKKSLKRILDDVSNSKNKNSKRKK